MNGYDSQIIDHLKDRKFKSILDVGCGDGDLIRAIQEEFPRVSVAGCDISDKCKYCDITKKLPYNANSYDIVCTAAVLIYFSDEMAERILRKIKRVARKEVFFVEMHNDKETSIDYSIRDYEKILSELKFKNIQCEPLKCGWPGANNCKDCGYLISAKV